MIRFERVLAATDYSEGSRMALRAALKLAAPLTAHVELIHVWSAPFFGSEYAPVSLGSGRQSLFDLVRQQASEEMEKFVASLDAPEGIEIATRIEAGDPVRCLVDHIKASSPDLVAVGTHGRAGPKRWVLGSVAERLVQLSPAPVLVVPSAGVGSVDKAIGKILAPVDLSGCSGAALAFAVELSDKLGAGLEVLHVVPPPPYVPLDLALFGKVQDEYWQHIGRELSSFVEEHAGKFRTAEKKVPTRIGSGTPFDVIASAAEDFDLIVMGTHGRTGLPHLLLGSVTERVVRASPCPVITVPRSLD